MKRTKWTFGRFLTLFVLILLAALWIAPLISSFRASLSGAGFGNYLMILAFRQSGILLFPLSLMNSVFVCAISVAVILLLCLLASFGVTKLRFRGSNLVYAVVVSFFAVPIITTLLPNTLILKHLHLLNTYFAMILPLIAINIPTTLIIMKNFVEGIPDPLVEAAWADGASNLVVFAQVIVPLANAGIVNAAIVAGFLTWNDFVIPQIFVHSARLFPLTLLPGFFTLTLGKGIFGPLFASVILIAIPSC